MQPPHKQTQQQSRRLFARLLGLPAVAGSRCLSVYLSMPSKEVPTYPQLVGELMQEERTVYVPKVIDTEDDCVLWKRVKIRPPDVAPQSTPNHPFAHGLSSAILHID